MWERLPKYCGLYQENRLFPVTVIRSEYPSRGEKCRFHSRNRCEIGHSMSKRRYGEDWIIHSNYTTILSKVTDRNHQEVLQVTWSKICQITHYDHHPVFPYRYGVFIGHMESQQTHKEGGGKGDPLGARSFLRGGGGVAVVFVFIKFKLIGQFQEICILDQDFLLMTSEFLFSLSLL